MKHKPLTWEEVPFAGFILDPGNAEEYRTGDWRSRQKPVINHEKCTFCLLCWIYCPDGAIVRRQDKVEVDYYHCKGCGICSYECPSGAIKMKSEIE